MHLQPSLLGGGCEDVEPWSGCAWLQIICTASEIAFVPDQSDMAITETTACTVIILKAAVFMRIRCRHASVCST